MIRQIRHLYSPFNAGLVILSLVSLINLLLNFKGLPAEVSLRLECAKLMVQGKTPYIDFFVLDSPLALFLSVIPVKVAAVLGLEGWNIRCTLIFEWIVSVAALALCTALIVRRKRLRQSLWCQTMLITVAVLNIACLYQFGQPEHFLMLGITPYLLARWLEYTGRKLTKWESILSGTIGGLAVLLDPFFLVVPVAIEFALLTYFMRFSVRLCSPLSSLILSSSIAGSIIVFGNQAMWSNYSSYILPLLIADRQSFDMRLYGLMSCPDSRVFIYEMLLSSLFVLAMRNKNSLIAPLVILSWLGFAYFIAECKGYFYQAVPMFWTASLVLTICGATLLKDLRRWSRRWKLLNWRLVPVVSVLTAIATCGFLYLEKTAETMAHTARKSIVSSGYLEVPDLTEAVTRESVRFERLLVLNNNVAPAYPAMTFQERTPGSRIMWSFFIPILNRMNESLTIPPAETARLSKFYFNILKEDLEKNPPELVLVETGWVWDSLKREGLTTVLEKRYSQCGEAMFYSHNLPPVEYSNPNYRLAVFKIR